MDRGMSSQENRKILQRAGGQYILGEKLSGTKLNEQALAHPGRFKVVNDSLQIKEVHIGNGTARRRYVIAYNPRQAELDRINREQILARLSCELEAVNAKRSSKAQCNLLLQRSMGRYAKELKSGKLRIDEARVKQDERLDGKYLLSTSDRHLSAEDIVFGYKQLLEVERAFRTLKSTLGLRPVYHSKDERIRSHVLLCWLSLLLVRIAEVETGQSWPAIRRQMQQQHVVDLCGINGHILQNTETTNHQRNTLKKRKISIPKRILRTEIPV